VVRIAWPAHEVMVNAGDKDAFLLDSARVAALDTSLLLAGAEHPLFERSQARITDTGGDGVPDTCSPLFPLIAGDGHLIAVDGGLG